MKRNLSAIIGFLIALFAVSWCRIRLDLWFDTFEFDDFVSIPGLGLIYPNTLLRVVAYAIPFFAAGVLSTRISPYSKNPVSWATALGVVFLMVCLAGQITPRPIPTPIAVSSTLPLLVIYWSNWWLPPVAAAIGAAAGSRLFHMARANAA
jgi:hypothetical protein